MKKSNGSRTHCQECGKCIEGKRSTKKYCSACKQKLYRERKKAKEGGDKATLTIELYTDLGRLRAISPQAAKSLEVVMAHGGQVCFMHGIQAVWDTLVDLGYAFNDQTKQWEMRQ